jgi:predicted thioredoxin/glutaredoxin
MCRLFGMSGGGRRVRATFWLLERELGDDRALVKGDTHQLWVLERGAGGRHGGRHLDAASAAGTVRVR